MDLLNTAAGEMQRQRRIKPMKHQIDAGINGDSLLQCLDRVSHPAVFLRCFLAKYPTKTSELSNPYNVYWRCWGGIGLSGPTCLDSLVFRGIRHRRAR